MWNPATDCYRAPRPDWRHLTVLPDGLPTVSPQMPGPSALPKGRMSPGDAWGKKTAAY